MRSNEVDTEFAYDPLGRRLLKHSTPKLPIGAGAQAAVNPAWVASETARLSREHGYGVTLYGWDGDQIAWEGDAETTTHYVFEPGSFVPLLQAKTRQRIPLLPTPDWSERNYDIDADPLWTYNPEPQPFEQLYYYHTDHLGTPQELLDAEGNLAWSADYKAWGEAKAAISEAAKRAGISNPLRFQGQYFDHETGLHYNRHRYYDPQIGRFISKDPISLQGGLNIFAYAPNPVEWIDPFGLKRQRKGPGSTKKVSDSNSQCPCTCGNDGESIAIREMQKSRKYKNIWQIQNNSGHGIDIIAEKWSGDLIAYEVKTQKGRSGYPALSKDQNTGKAFVLDRLNKAANAKDPQWKHMAGTSTQQDAQNILSKINSGSSSLSGSVLEVDCSSGNAATIRHTKWF
ncbi:RHS repeat-associated core domain-containing protein [Chitinilyticum litopenaei]|uniref:RHS repeat-associated core domain-containing protein n=1 Tax=Chitinilyticum litopenaei TaxID=1121276 RepID=UPI0004077BBB|nr:RHS repeat-associated core domain-containing protein [Chitinilyticum litopenaei]